MLRLVVLLVRQSRSQPCNRVRLVVFCLFCEGLLVTERGLGFGKIRGNFGKKITQARPVRELSAIVCSFSLSNKGYLVW